MTTAASNKEFPGISDFLAEVKNKGLAVTNRFNVIITFPQKVIDPTNPATPISSRTVSLYCESTNIPGLNISTNQITIYGETRSHAYQKIFDDIDMSFYVDKDMQMVYLFHLWLALIADPSKRTLSYYDDYIADVQISILSKYENETFRITLKEAYPSRIDPVNISMDSQYVYKLNVNWQYKYYTVESFTSINDPEIINDKSDLEDSTVGTIIDQTDDGSVSTSSNASPGVQTP